MRILNRPMFRYGGPIKEGVMHGMRNNYQSGQLVRPGPGRPGYQGKIPKSRLGVAGWLGKKIPFLKQPITKLSTSTKDIIPRAGQYFKNLFGSTTPVRHTPVTRVPGGTVKNTWGINTTTQPSWKAGKEVTENIWSPSYLGKTSEFQLGKKIWEGRGFLGKPIKAGAQFLYRTPTASIPLIYFGGKWVMKDGTPAPDQDKINKQAGAAGSGVPGGGDRDMTYTDPDAAKKLAKEKQNERMKSYLDMMGYDSAKKTAMSDALIDASALVQDATTEAGSLKKADWGKLINKAIQTTSKRLDKPEQIREAVGLMSTKAAIAKDMTAEEDALKKIATKLQIKIGQKTLAGETLNESINAAFQKSGKFPTGATLAGVARTKGIEVTKVIPTKEIPDDMSAIAYITKITENAKNAGKPYPEGHYVIKDRLVEIDVNGNIIKQVI